MKMLILSLLIFSLIPPTFSQEYVKKHFSCKVGLSKKLEKKYENLFPTLEESLKERGYKSFKIENNTSFVGPRNLYLTLEKELLGRGIYPDCYIKMIIKEAKNMRPSSEDEFYFKRSTKRKFPRITLKGKYRCRKALKDLFIHIPYCRLDEKP
jgi:hypothetical protein